VSFRTSEARSEIQDRLLLPILWIPDRVRDDGKNQDPKAVTEVIFVLKPIAEADPDGMIIGAARVALERTIGIAG
jgi:hypothetical protein